MLEQTSRGAPANLVGWICRGRTWPGLDVARWLSCRSKIEGLMPKPSPTIGINPFTKQPMKLANRPTRDALVLQDGEEVGEMILSGPPTEVLVIGRRDFVLPVARRVAEALDAELAVVP